MQTGNRRKNSDAAFLLARTAYRKFGFAFQIFQTADGSMSQRKSPAPSEPEAGFWPMDKLRPHPLQPDFFDDLAEPQLAELAASMRDRGLDHLVEILPDGTILRGHQRCRAAKLLGWTTIAVKIRHDLVGQPDDVVLRFLIEDNLVRRQLGPMAIGRCYQAQRAMHRANGSRPRGTDREALRDRLGKLYGLSGRQIDRYARLLVLPRVLQAAVDRGLLPVSVAEKALKFSEEDLETVVRNVQEGADPKAAILEIADRKDESKKVAPLADFVFHIEKALHQFRKQRLGNTVPTEYQRQVLVECRKTIERLVANPRSRRK